MIYRKTGCVGAIPQLNPLAGVHGQHDRITRVEITINGGSLPITADLVPSELEPTVIALPRPFHVRKLAVAIEQRVPGKQKKGLCGFAEVALEMR